MGDFKKYEVVFSIKTSVKAIGEKEAEEQVRFTYKALEIDSVSVKEIFEEEG